MDKLTAFLKNVWFRRAVALIAWGYTALMIRIAWLCFGFYFEFENPTPLFVLYLFVNIAAMGLMIFTRKQVFTQINAYILPPIVFAIVIFGFGNWYIIAPPVAVMIVLFFVNSSNETLKTVLGTMYLLMFVIGVVGYIGMRMFMGNITLSLDDDGMISFSEVDLSLRDTEYENLSESGDYRVVRYLESMGDRKTVTYYIEYTGDDVDIPLGKCKKVIGCKHIHTATFKSAEEDHIRWGTQKLDGKTVDALYVEGSLRENPYLIKDLDAEFSSVKNKYSYFDFTSSKSSSQSKDDSEPEESSDPDDSDNSADEPAAVTE